MPPKTLDLKSEVRVLGLFELFARQGRPLSLSEIAEDLGIPVSSCFNLLRAVEDRGYLYADKARGPLYPTRRLYDIATAVFERDVVMPGMRARLQALRDKTGETVCLGCRKESSVVYLDVQESPQAIRFAVQPGDRRDVHSNSIGKAILSTYDAGTLAATLASLTYRRHTPKTLRNAVELEADIERGRADGWYANRGESTLDALACAVPVRLGSGWYGMAIVGPVTRMQDRLQKHLSALQTAAREIERLSRVQHATASA